jgi:hypothetical protein
VAGNAVELQRRYYAATADCYDEMHVRDDDEHGFALCFLLSVVEHFRIRSLLDIGSGTGRGLLKITTACPDITAMGIEPSPELRKVGHSKGLLETQLIDGDAMNLARCITFQILQRLYPRCFESPAGPFLFRTVIILAKAANSPVCLSRRLIPLDCGISQI